MLDLKKPKSDDLERLELIHSEMGKSGAGEVVKTPGSFLVFEQELMVFSMKKNSRGILSLKECLTIGARLKMNQEDVEAALIFSHHQFSILYFHHILQNLMVTRPQTPLDCMNAVVRLSYNVGFGEMKGVSENMVSSLKDGIITEETLSHKEITQCFIPGLYEPQHTIELLSHTFTLAPLSLDAQPTSPTTTILTPSITKEYDDESALCHF